MRLEAFLGKKPLYYKAFDPMRMVHAYESIKHELDLPKIIHIIGTNGKGSTGRYMAQMLQQAGYRVGHYSSPHILKFNERIWLNGSDVDDTLLEHAFETLQQLLAPKWQETLSYFEYTTLLAMVVYEGCDYVVLEAGLGGEYDATAVFDNLFTVITPIGMDHEAFLGSTIDAVVETKLNGVRHEAIVAKQSYPGVEELIQIHARKKGYPIEFVQMNALSKDDRKLIETFSQRSEARYLVENFQTALTAFRRISSKNVDIAKITTLFGRLTPVAPNVVLDVGHNALAAERIRSHFGKSKVNLVYNSFEDKSYGAILETLAPIINEVEIIDVDDERIVATALLEAELKRLGLPFRRFEMLRDDKSYLVFGSFSVAEAFLKRING